MAPVRARGTPSIGGAEPIPLAVVTIAFSAILGVVALLLRPQTFTDRVVTLGIGLAVALVILAIALLIPSATASGGEPAGEAQLDVQRAELERLGREVTFLADRVAALERPVRRPPQALVQGTSR